MIRLSRWQSAADHQYEGKPSMQKIIARIRDGQSLNMDEMATVVDAIMQGQLEEDPIAEFLLALRAKGETVEEIAGAARAMRRHMTPIRTVRTDALDTCGTGGDGSQTFNISTAAALVTAACGVPVAKHGNRGMTSRSGSADVLAVLGVNIEADVATVERCLDQVGIGFCFAPQLHPSMRHVGPVRRRLGVPTIFNLLGPLCNPAAAPYQLLGVGRPESRSRLAAALRLLGATRAAVVSGEDGLDEVTLAGETNVSEVTPEGIREFVWTPESFGIARGDLQTLTVDGPQTSAEMIQAVLDGQPGAHRDIVLLNSAAALWIVGQDPSLEVCCQRAAYAIDQGDAKRVLQALAETSHRATIKS
jgi:anthranilate phosphoribosyltransferase